MSTTLMVLDASVRPCFALADLARAAITNGRMTLALQLFSQAISAWQPGDAPIDEDGHPELWWPKIWEGSCMTLQALPLVHFDLPPATTDMAALLDSAADLT